MDWKSTGLKEVPFQSVGVYCELYENDVQLVTPFKMKTAGASEGDLSTDRISGICK